MNNNAEVIVVGAGVSGLIAAREIRKSGRDVLVIEKSRGVGGRMATRRVGEAAFDTGAQFFTARDRRFLQVVADLEGVDAVRPWFHGESSRGATIVRYRGVPSMTGPAKHVAMDTDVRLTVRAEAISRASGGGWQINADEGREYRATAVIVTAPIPQTLALLDAGEVALDAGTRDALLGAHYDPCLAVLVRIKEEVALGEPGVVESSSEVIDWIADNHVKGVSTAGPALTIHCRPRFSQEFYDKPDEQIIDTVAEGLPPTLAAPRREASVKRWRYARPKVERGSPLRQESGFPGLFFAGDAFHSPRVEGAAVSGFAAADLAMRYLQTK